MSTTVKRIKTTAVGTTARGSFSGVIDFNPPEGDYDGERIESFSNVPTTVPLGYQHTAHDPGAIIGTAHASPKGDGRHLLIRAKLDVDSNPMARATHERLLLPSSDAQSLSQLSVGFSVDTWKVWTDARGVRVLPNVTLLEVSVVHRGAQNTVITDVKARKPAVAGGSRCTCGATVTGAFKTVRAVKHGKDLGPLSFRRCSRCGMYELRANAAIQRADSADAWVRFIKRRSARGSVADLELVRFNKMLDALDLGTAGRAIPRQDRVGTRTGRRQGVVWYSRSLDWMETVPRG